MHTSIKFITNATLLSLTLTFGWSYAAHAQLGSVGEGLGGVVDGLSGDDGGLGGITDGLSGIGDGLGGVTDGLGGSGDGLGGITDGLGGIGDSLGGVTDGLGGVTDGLGGISDGLGGIGEDLGGVSGGLGSVTDGLGGALGSIDELGDSANNILDTTGASDLTGLNIDLGIVDDLTGTLSDTLGIDLPALLEILDLDSLKGVLFDLLRRLQSENLVSGISGMQDKTDLHSGWINPKRFGAPFDAIIRDLNTTIVALQAIHTPANVLPGMAYSKSGSAEVAALLMVARMKMEDSSATTVILGQTLFMSGILSDLPANEYASALQRIAPLLASNQQYIADTITEKATGTPKLELERSLGMLASLQKSAGLQSAASR